MSLELLSGIVTALIVLIPVFLSIYFIVVKKVKSWLLKAFLILLFLFTALLFWYVESAVLSIPIGNLFPNMKGVPCFGLNKKNCLQRSDCETMIVGTGLGKETVVCGKKHN